MLYGVLLCAAPRAAVYIYRESHIWNWRFFIGLQSDEKIESYDLLSNSFDRSSNPRPWSETTLSRATTGACDVIEKQNNRHKSTSSSGIPKCPEGSNLFTARFHFIMYIILSSVYAESSLLYRVCDGILTNQRKREGRTRSTWRRKANLTWHQSDSYIYYK